MRLAIYDQSKLSLGQYDKHATNDLYRGSTRNKNIDMSVMNKMGESAINP